MLAALTRDVEELHGRCNVLRRQLGHSVAAEPVKATLAAHGLRGSAVLQRTELPPAALAALAQLRETKATELQMLSLRCCGMSTRHVHGAQGRAQGDRFNVKLMLAVADCMEAQHSALAAHAQQHEALQRELRVLRDAHGKGRGQAALAGLPDICVAPPKPRAASAGSQRSAAAAAAAAAVAAAATAASRTPDASGASDAPAHTGRSAVDAAGTAIDAAFSAAVTGGGGGAARGASMVDPAWLEPSPPSDPKPPMRPHAPASAPPAGRTPAHRAAPSLSRGGARGGGGGGGCGAAADAAYAAGSAGEDADGGAGLRLRLVDMRRKLDEANAELALWKRQFATRLEAKVEEHVASLDGKPARPRTAGPLRGTSKPDMAVGSLAKDGPGARLTGAASPPLVAPAPIRTVVDRAALDAATARAEAAEAEREEGRRELEALRDELAAAKAEADESRTAASTAQAEAAQSAEELKAAQEALVAPSAEEQLKLLAAERKAAALKSKAEASAAAAAVAEAAVDRAVHSARAEVESRWKRESKAVQAELGTLRTELERSRAAAAEVPELQQQLAAAKRRLEEVQAQHAAEAARGEASARHELTLEKKAAKAAAAALEGKLKDETARAARAMSKVVDAEMAMGAAVRRAQELAAERDRAVEEGEAARARLAECEGDVAGLESRQAAWADERGALTGEIEAERGRAEASVAQADAMSGTLQSEREVRKSMAVLLKSRLEGLAANSPSDLANGASSLHTLLGRAAELEEILQRREELLSATFSLLGARHAIRIATVDRAAEARERAQSTAERIDSMLDGASGVAAGGVGVESLRAELGELSDLLRQQHASGASAAQTVAAQEESLRAAAGRFAARHAEQATELHQAKARIGELEDAIAAKQAKAAATKEAALAKHGSAEYHASAPQPRLDAGLSPAKRYAKAGSGAGAR